MNFINRMPALRENLPETGPIHPSLMELNMLLGRKLYDVRDIEFVSPVPKDESFRVACVGEDCAEFELLEAFSQQAELETTRFITTTDVVEAVTPGFSFEAPFALCTLKDFIECRRKFGNVDAYRKPPPSNTDYFKLIGDHVLSFLH